MPVDKDDQLALQHDLAYLAALTNYDLDKADNIMTSRLDNNFHGLVGKAGLFLRGLLGIDLSGGQPVESRKLEYDADLIGLLKPI